MRSNNSMLLGIKKMYFFSCFGFLLHFVDSFLRFQGSCQAQGWHSFQKDQIKSRNTWYFKNTVCCY